MLAGAAGVHLAWALATSKVRFLLPGFPLLSLCAAMAVENRGLPRWLLVYEVVDRPNPPEALTPNPVTAVLRHGEPRSP